MAKPHFSCATCAFFCERSAQRQPLSSGNKAGQCRARSPVLVLDQAQRAQTMWPMVYSDQWCGEHSTVVPA